MSYLIASVHSALLRVEDGASDREPHIYVAELKIGLRNLKALLLLSGEADGRLNGCLNALLQCLLQACCPVAMADLLSTEFVMNLYSRIGRVLYLLIHAKEIDAYSMARNVHLLGKELEKELSLNGTYRYRSSSPLTVDEVAGIADSAIDNAPDFLHLIYHKRFFQRQTDAFEAVDAFQIHMRFMKDVLVFARRAGVELEHVLRLYIQPIVINAARVYNDDRLSWRCEERFSIIGSKCLEVNRMATDPQVYQAYSHTLAMARLSSTLPHMGDETVRSLVYSLVSLLWYALRHASDSEMKDGFKLLFGRLRFLRDVVKQRPTSLNEAICGQVLALICDVGVLICSFHQPDAGQLSDLLHRFDVFREQVIAASPTMLEHDELSFDDFKTTDVSDGSEKAPRGFHGDEVVTVLDRLIGGSKHLRIVPICGMAGLGKTTFALKLLDHPSVLHHFWIHAWCPVSQELDKKKVLRQLLNQILPGDYPDKTQDDLANNLLTEDGVESNLPTEDDLANNLNTEADLASKHQSKNGASQKEDTEDDLANKLRQSLKGRRYLILLDDVWSPEAWNSLKASFPDDSTGSRIILTSRRVDIAPSRLPDETPHLLRLREESECVEILQAKLSHKHGWSFDLGRKVAKICKGLPLTLVIVSGILATTKQEGWKAILDHLSSGNNVSGTEQCNIAFELGYRHLPDYLQPCFLYFGAFPEDEEVSVKMLLRLWTAEGFVITNELKRTEDVGREYVEKLIERSLIMVGNNRSLGGAKTVHVHDLLHGFCRSKMKQENLIHPFLQMHDQLCESEEMRNLSRLSVHTAPTDFKDARLFYPGALSLLFFSGPDTHLFDISFIVHIFQALKVLHMDRVWLTNGIPNEIGLLTRLSYLSFRTSIPIIPSSVGNLSNLETFIAKFHTDHNIAFPSTLWQLQKLKHLCIEFEGWSRRFTLPVENLENSPSLLELETLNGAFFDSDGSMKKLLLKFPNIRRLKCTIIATDVSMDIPTELESLTMRAYVRFGCEFSLTAENLRKLKLERFQLSREEIGKIGKFPNLEVLKLTNVYFPNDTLGMEEEEFPKLRFLKLDTCYNLQRWTTSDDCDELPSLQRLECRGCSSLKELPSWLETSSTLEEIQVLWCSSALESLVRGIEEVQKDYGNLVFKLRIVSREEE